MSEGRKEGRKEGTNERTEGRTDGHTKEIENNCLRWFFGLYSGYTITYFSNSLTVLMLLKKDGSHRKPKGNKIIQFTKQTQPGNYFSRGHLVGQSLLGKHPFSSISKPQYLEAGKNHRGAHCNKEKKKKSRAVQNIDSK